ncbi:TlpA family protein disulfide reductase [Aliikangiella coralliicola]|uniref:TlpA family protein disulfide reductase n=1 Tax=Aliikangiella coralliicola TaxID=2592383 RepID=A0A545U4Z5_9GAMM|nr:TlpA disulfide reductase family protein [Aliikangiella coralliicola]TQV84545.1 TlpA family protein disulfide reductase [Aliikangiella coralliicola]
MKTIAYFFCLILFPAVLFISSCSQNGQFQLLDGKKYSLDDFEGQWLIINFWAEWCAPCLEEVPALNQIAANGESLNLKVIGVSYDPLPKNKLIEIIQKWEFKYAVMLTEPTPILPFGLPPTLPSNYLISPDGQVVHKLVGTQTVESLEKALNHAKQQYNK